MAGNEAICEVCGQLHKLTDLTEVKLDLHVVVYRRAVCLECGRKLFHAVREIMGTPELRKEIGGSR